MRLFLSQNCPKYWRKIIVVSDGGTEVVWLDVGARVTPVKSIGSIGSLWAILSVEQPIPGIGVRLAPLSPVFRHPARGWPSQGDTISLLSASDAARDCARRP